MSQAKINGKSLHYDQSLPPFLARLRGQATADAAQAPDPILAARRRPAKQRSRSEDAEDAPLVVDEAGNVVASVSVERDGTVKEVAAGSSGRREAGGDVEDDEGTTRQTPADVVDSAVENVAGIGGSKKRKAGRVIGGGEQDQDQDHDQDRNSESAGKNNAGTGGPEKEKIGKPIAKGKKKAKKIKLSFGDDDGEGE